MKNLKAIYKETKKLNLSSTYIFELKKSFEINKISNYYSTIKNSDLVIKHDDNSLLIKDNYIYTYNKNLKAKNTIDNNKFDIFNIFIQHLSIVNSLNLIQFNKKYVFIYNLVNYYNVMKFNNELLINYIYELVNYFDKNNLLDCKLSDFEHDLDTTTIIYKKNTKVNNLTFVNIEKTENKKKNIMKAKELKKQGLTNKEISEKLNISLSTAKRYIAEIYGVDENEVKVEIKDIIVEVNYSIESKNIYNKTMNIYYKDLLKMMKNKQYTINDFKPLILNEK